MNTYTPKRFGRGEYVDWRDLAQRAGWVAICLVWFGFVGALLTGRLWGAP